MGPRSRIDSPHAIPYDPRHALEATTAGDISRISLGMIAIEAALAGIAAVKARYRAIDTFASLGMQVGNIAMNLMMAGVVFAGLSAAYQFRLFEIRPAHLGVGGDFLSGRLHLLLVPSHQPRVPVLVGGARESSFLAEIQSVDGGAPIMDQRDRGYLDPWIPLALLGFPRR